MIALENQRFKRMSREMMKWEFIPLYLSAIWKKEDSSMKSADAAEETGTSRQSR